MNTSPLPADLPTLGDRTGTLLLSLFQDSYRQEIGAEEDIHRTLPFFATALGLVIAAITYVAGQLPTWETLRSACPASRERFFDMDLLACGWPRLLATVLVGLAAILGIAVIAFLAAATNRQAYLRAGPEAEHLNRAMQPQAFHLAHDLVEDVRDQAVAQDLREQLLADFARVIAINRGISLHRYRLRARAVNCLLLSLLCALTATILVVAVAKTGQYSR